MEEVMGFSDDTEYFDVTDFEEDNLQKNLVSKYNTKLDDFEEKLIAD